MLDNLGISDYEYELSTDAGDSQWGVTGQYGDADFIWSGGFQDLTGTLVY